MMFLAFSSRKKNISTDKNTPAYFFAMSVKKEKSFIMKTSDGLLQRGSALTTAPRALQDGH
jgi:hypothetical protein